MNLDRIKKSIGERVQLRPAAIPLDDVRNGLPIVDDAWIIDAVSEDDMRISNPRTGHFTHLGKDHIHHYTSNPDESRRSGIAHGFFTLNIQIYLQGATLTVTPTARPGEPVPPRGSPISEQNVDINYPSDSGLQQRLAAEGFRVAWARESMVARRTNLEGWSIVVEPAANGQLVRYRVKDRHEDLVLIMRPQDAT